MLPVLFLVLVAMCGDYSEAVDGDDEDDNGAWFASSQDTSSEDFNDCVEDDGCDPNLICVRGLCVDPCQACHHTSDCYVDKRDRVPVCSCKPGYIGNPVQGCTFKWLPECDDDKKCPPKQVCFNHKCVTRVRSEVRYPNTECGQGQSHIPFCTCKAGFQWLTKPTCYPYMKINCLDDRECAEEEVCDTFSCVNPCTKTPCGPNTDCIVAHHVRTCVCKHNYIGDPDKGCHAPECTANAHCRDDQICKDFYCVSTCPGPCGQNTICQGFAHYPICYCKNDFYGDPLTGCIQKQCLSSAQCKDDEVCDEFNCVDPCPGVCGANADCQVSNHLRNCVCKPGYAGDPIKGCHAAGCTSIGECENDQTCEGNQCVSVCPGPCGANTDCTPSKHVPVCVCKPGYSGNPLQGCEPIGCTSSQQCGLDQTCEDNQCVDVCPGPCGANTDCTILTHDRNCACKPDHSGNPLQGCQPLECTSNGQCRQDQSCVDNKCVDVCPGPCGPNTDCKVTDHDRNCVCKVGHVGDPLQGCTPLECTSSDQCKMDQHCEDHKCVDLCPGPCGPNTDCQYAEHVRNCVCKPGYDGNPLIGCHLLECTSNARCRQDQHCENNKCVDLCPGPCGLNTDCTAAHHFRNCDCKLNHAGDPLTACHPFECTTSKQCREDEVCEDNRCGPACPGPCGPNTDCKVVNHVRNCVCAFGHVGNPLEGCTPLDCTSNGQCRQDQSCVDNKCVDLCPGPCGPNTDCRITDHVRNCVCKPRHVGDPLQGCTALECTSKSHCLAEQTCENNKCVSACPGPCGANTDCKASKHIPACTCQPGYGGNPMHGCHRVECTSNSQCQDEKVCENNQCVSGCPGPCGPNTECFVVNHLASCGCKPKHAGNPVGVTGCTQQECTENEHCPDNLACKDLKCKNPCDGLCDANAECRVSKHLPACACNPAYMGDPYTKCQPVAPGAVALSKTYHFSQLGPRNLVTWADAVASCKRQNFALVNIENEAQQRILKVLIRTKAPLANFWTGGVGTLNAKFFWYSTSRPFTYYNFFSTPTTVPETFRCVMMTKQRDHQWELVDCYTKAMFICQS